MDLTDAAITIPISVAFPSLTRRSGRSGRWRSGAAAAAAVNATTPAGSYDDPVFVHQLRNIDLFMDYFQVNMHHAPLGVLNLDRPSNAILGCSSS